MWITSKHPVRNAVANIPAYHDSKGEALAAVYRVCAEWGIEVVCSDLVGLDGYVNLSLRPVPGGRIVCDCCAKASENAFYNNSLVFSWYTMPSGRVELTVYVS